MCYFLGKGCHGYGGNQKFIWDPDAKVMHHQNGCLEVAGDHPQVAVCNDKQTQKWEFIDAS